MSDRELYLHVWWCRSYDLVLLFQRRFKLANEIGKESKIKRLINLVLVLQYNAMHCPSSRRLMARAISCQGLEGWLETGSIPDCQPLLILILNSCGIQWCGL